MAVLQFSTALRDDLAGRPEAVIGTSPLVQFYTGALPANPAAAATGTKLGEIPCPADWLSVPSTGSVTKVGTWSVAAIAAGNIGYFRIVNTAGTVCTIQGDVTATAGGGAMTVDNINVAVSQNIVVNSFTLTAPGA